MELKNTQTICDLIRNADEEFGAQTYLRYEIDDRIYDISYHHVRRRAEAVAVWAAKRRREAGRPLHIAFFGMSGKQYIETLIGVTMSGNVAVPLDLKLDVAALADSIERADTDIIFCDDSQRELIQDAADRSGISECYFLQDSAKFSSVYQIFKEYDGQILG